MKENQPYGEFRTKSGGLHKDNIKQAIENAKTEAEREELRKRLIERLSFVNLNFHLFDIYYVVRLIGPFVGEMAILEFLNSHRAKLYGTRSLGWLSAQYTKGETLFYADRMKVVAQFLEHPLLLGETRPARKEAEKFLEKVIKTLANEGLDSEIYIHPFLKFVHRLFRLNRNHPFIREMLVRYKDDIKKAFRKMRYKLEGELSEVYFTSHGDLEELLEYINAMDK
jgi:hypothetical protein